VTLVDVGFSSRWSHSNKGDNWYIISIIFASDTGKPLIIRSTAREEITRKFPPEPHMFPIKVTSLDSTDNKRPETGSSV
jgi:hypothetical protein